VVGVCVCGVECVCVCVCVSVHVVNFNEEVVGEGGNVCKLAR